MNTLTPSDFATEQQIARNHARLHELTDRTPAALFASELAREQHLDGDEAADCFAQINQAARNHHAQGGGLPLFAC